MTQKIAIVTGANRGIGLEICRQLAGEGVTVVLTARSPAKGEEAVKRLQADGLKVQAQPLDVLDPDSIHRLVAFVEAEFGRLDILVNNAGIFIDRGELGLKVELDKVKSTMSTNLYGPLLLCQAVVPLMKKDNYGRIVNISSMMSQLSGMGGQAMAYRMSKTALNAMTAVLAQELSGSNILINTMSPGWVRTDMGGPNASRSVEQGADTAVWLALLPDGSPSGKFFDNRQSIPW